MTMLPLSVTRDELAHISAAVGEIAGWDWSRMRASRDPTPFDYREVVRSLVRREDRVLDIGTGGAEVLLDLQLDASMTVAIDHQIRMARVAHERIAAAAQPIRVVVGDAQRLPFDDEQFDRVLCRHANTSPPEVTRVLRAGGTFIMQGVGRRNTQSLFDAFGWGSNWEQFRDEPLPPKDRHALAEEFEAIGCRVIRTDEYDVGYAFADIESLVFFLKSAPCPEEFDPDRHVAGINWLLANHRSHRGIETAEHRELVVVQRPAE